MVLSKCKIWNLESKINFYLKIQKFNHLWLISKLYLFISTISVHSSNLAHSVFDWNCVMSKIYELNWCVIGDTTWSLSILIHQVHCSEENLSKVSIQLCKVCHFWHFFILVAPIKDKKDLLLYRAKHLYK